jgi:hypothetical protein
VKQTC